MISSQSSRHLTCWQVSIQLECRLAKQHVLTVHDHQNGEQDGQAAWYSEFRSQGAALGEHQKKARCHCHETLTHAKCLAGPSTFPEKKTATVGLEATTTRRKCLHSANSFRHFPTFFGKRFRRQCSARNSRNNQHLYCFGTYANTSRTGGHCHSTLNYAAGNTRILVAGPEATIYSFGGRDLNHWAARAEDYCVPYLANKGGHWANEAAPRHR